MALGGYLLLDNMSFFKQAEFNLLDKNQPIAENYHPDPPAVRVTYRSNVSGEIETFLQYAPDDVVKSEIPVHKDLMPDTKTMLEGLESRVNMGGVYLNVKKNDQGINEIYAMYKEDGKIHEKKIDNKLFQPTKNEFQSFMDYILK